MVNTERPQDSRPLVFLDGKRETMMTTPDGDLEPLIKHGDDQQNHVGEGYPGNGLLLFFIFCLDIIEGVL